MIYIPEANMPICQNIDLESLTLAMNNHSILCAKAIVYEKGVGLRFNLGGFETIMPLNQVEYHQNNDPTKEAAIVTRVNKNVCFIIIEIDTSGDNPLITVSRKAVQEKAFNNYVSKLIPGDVIPCKITHVDSFGVFCDIACGITALLPIDFISVSRINKPSDRFVAGQDIYACIKSIDEFGKIVLTHKELLGTWYENAKLYSTLSGTTGIVRSTEPYGIFIELMPNLAGLAEVCEGVAIGDVVNVYIKSIIPDKMKIKLVITSVMKNGELSKKIKYFITEGHIDYWKYSTENSKKIVDTQF